MYFLTFSVIFCRIIVKMAFFVEFSQIGNSNWKLEKQVVLKQFHDNIMARTILCEFFEDKC